MLNCSSSMGLARFGLGPSRTSSSTLEWINCETSNEWVLKWLGVTLRVCECDSRTLCGSTFLDSITSLMFVSS